MEVGKPTLKAEIEEKVGKNLGGIGYAKAMKNKWIKNVDKTTVERTAENIEDTDRDLLKKLDENKNLEAHDKKMVDNIKKRKMIQVVSHKSYKVSKGANFNPIRVKLQTELTLDMLRSGKWKDLQFKKLNFNARGVQGPGGQLHPLLKVRTLFREILLEMGFEEMPTNRYVETSFWCFDSLFVPQSHPARDMQDTFFVKEPKYCKSIPDAYSKKVSKTHEEGLEGSLGYGYKFSEEETKKNVLRTHTTAISAQMLKALAD
jgi:phenylalanyl-tRNA synthetase alpha chain